jgi:hypothetical protein
MPATHCRLPGSIGSRLSQPIWQDGRQFYAARCEALGAVGASDIRASARAIPSTAIRPSTGRQARTGSNTATSAGNTASPRSPEKL